MLSLKNIVVHYGGVQALKGVSLEAGEGTITTLIGANGAGKSTTLRAISGLVSLTSGEILFRNQRIDGFEPEEIMELGIGHVPEGKKLFLEMSIRDNLLTGAFLRTDKTAVQRDIERVCQYFPVLEQAYSRPAAQMSGGEQQMLAIARGLMGDPKMLLLDEPSLGLSPLLTREVGAIIGRIAGEGMTILLIEQNASLALHLARRCYVLETGRMVLEGDSEQLRNNRHVKAAYLGVDPEGEAPVLDTDAAEGPDASGRSRPGTGSRVFEHDLEPALRPRKNRIPPEAAPVLGENRRPGVSRWGERDRWTLGDPDPAGLRPRDRRREEEKTPPDESPPAAPTKKSPITTGGRAVVKKIIDPRQR